MLKILFQRFNTIVSQYLLSSSHEEKELEQSHINDVRSVNRHPEPEIDMSDTDIESVGSRPDESHDYGHEHRE